MITRRDLLRGVEGGTLDLAVIERNALGLAVFEEKLAVVHAGEGVPDPRLDASAVHAGAVDALIAEQLL